MNTTNGNGHKPKPKNVLGGELQSCCTDPMTGFYRDGFCHTGANDTGSHVVCAIVTDEFLRIFKEVAETICQRRVPNLIFRV